MSFTDEYLELRKKRKQEQEAEFRKNPVTAPLFVNKTAPLYNNDDIAPSFVPYPSEKKEEKEERTVFQSGALEDGVSWKNVGKAILGTVTDAAEDIGTGLLGMGERIVDAGAFVAGGVGGLLGADKFQSDMEAFVKKDLYDENEVAKKILSGLSSAAYTSGITWAGGSLGKSELETAQQMREESREYIDLEMEDDSVLAERADAFAQSVGNYLGQAVATSAGIPWWLTVGVTSFGGKVESALNDGATGKEAAVSGLISAGGEILGEKFFGGMLGEVGFDDAMAKHFSRTISNKFWRNFATVSGKSFGEGLEEEFSLAVERFGDWLTYKKKRGESLKDMFLSEEAVDEAIETFFGGALLGGGKSTVDAVVSGKKGVDYASGLTENEQKVVDKEYADRVAEAEKDGNVSQKEKTKIYDAVVSDMEKGRISIDTIEEVLGGDTYKAYRETVAREDALSERFAFIGNKTNATLAEQSEYAELKTKLDEMKKTSKRSELKSKLGEEVFGSVQNDRLMESYNERGRRSQAFEADLTQYKGKQQETIRKAVESGVLNNTRRTHEFVDMIAKISADKGVLFDFTNNEKLKGSVFAADGKAVNGYVTKDGVTLNINSAKAIESVVGHEITHVLEGTELYTALQSAVVEYAKTKGEYDSRLADLTETYKNIKDANVDAELTADLVGDYLFTDTDFINNLATNKTVFQKIYDEIKYLCKVATAGSKEARELEKVKRAFEKAYQESGKVSNDTKYSVSASDVIDSLYNYDTVKFDKSVVDFNTEDFEAKWDKGYYTSVVETIAKHTGKSRQEVWNAFADILMKKDGIAKVDGKTYINVHELSEDNLRKAFELGGLAAPSIGIVDVDKPTTHFGRISLIFPDIFNPETVPTHYGDSYSTSLPAVAKFTDETMLADALTDGFDGMEYGGVLSQEEVYDLLRELKQFYIYDERQRTSHAISENGFRNAKEFAKDYSVKSIDGLRKLYDGLNGKYESYEQFLEDFAEKAFTNQRMHRYNTANSDFDWDDRAYKFRDFTLDDAVEEMTARGDDDFKFATGERAANYGELLSDGMRARLKASSTGFYEVKPQRAVYIDEATYAVVPESTSADIVEMLESEGVKVVKYQGVDGVTDGKAEAIKGILESDTTGIRYSLSDSDGKPIDSARISTNEFDTKYSLSHNAEIAKGQTDYIGKHRAYVTDEELAEAQRVTAAMVDVMMKYSNILPEDKIGKVLTKNGSYDRSVENTTICVRTLAYNEFVDKVQEELGRPLTQMESFLVSQKLYDIATEPQCLYCYVSLDRKAFNDMLLRYMTDRDTVIAKYNNSDKSPAAVEALYEEFLHGRKPTKEMRTRFDAWLGYVDDGVQLLSLADIATEDRQGVIKANGGILAEQLKDARKYAQSASWSKIQKNYVAYRDEILKLGDRVVKNLNEHYGLRWYSFSDYSAAFIVENMQQITDASIRGLKGLAYTKDTDFAEIFAPSGMNINISVFVNTDKDGNFFIDEKQSAKFEQAKALRERYPNVGIVATVTNDDALRWAASQEWSDVIIPFHIVRTGTDVAEYYKWLNYTSESADTIADKDMWNAYVDSLNLKSEGARKKVSKNIYPNEHKNDKSTYLALCESRGLTPRFVRFAGEDWYMKLVNETRLSADASATLKPIYDEEAAKASFQKFVDKGGYEGGWYHEGVDVDAEARAVADDVLAGKRANEVSYGRQDGFVPEDLIASRKTNRQHGRMSLSEQGEQFAPVRGLTYGKDIRLETAVPETVAPVVNAENAKTTPAVATPDEIAPVSTQKPDKITTAKDRAKAQLDSAYTEMSSLKNLREASKQDFDNEIAELEAEYESKKNKNTKLANNILRRIERTKAMRESVDADYAKRISDVEAKVERLGSATYTTAMQRKAKQKEYGDLIEKLVGNTKTWVDKKLGIQYQTNTFKRNLRDVVRKADGSRDIAKADAIYNELQGKYNQHEAQLNRRANEIKKKFADLKLTNAEDVYVQMLGELRHNPETTLSKEVVSDYYERNKNKINADKVDKSIEMARELYDGLFAEVNAVLREQGMKEIPYRKGYFPHFTEEKQSLIAKLFNWKTQNNRIPTDIAGLTEEFNPNRKWVSFNKRRTSDVTDYNFSKGLDSYVSGALDWIYHIEDIQKRRAFENYIRYTHSDAGVKERIKAIQNNDEYDANEMQDQIDLVYAEANNPLNNFVTDLRTGTNTLAGKKSSMDRGVEAATNRQFYSVMTNISNRVSANMVGGSVSSALTNFIPITQSWGEVSPVSSLKAMRDTLRSMYADDGVIDKSDFLTNRLNANEKLYKTTWDKISDGVTFMMSAVDNFTSQTVWRSKYMENINKGMSEAESIRNADEYASGLMADRSRGNMPTIFDSKNPLIKTLTAFQLEVANQYNYMFKDMPQNMKNEATSKLVKGYLSMFIGAYAYNALYSSVVGRNAAFDPIRILMELLHDIGDDEEEPIGVVTNLAENVLEEVPFVGGLLGGGRVPIQSALPYNGSLMDMLEGVGKIAEGDWSDLTSEWLKPVYYGVLPMGGGQIKKTAQGLAMFDEDLPIAGSYTNSGNLRFTVEDNIPNRVQAALFGQYASKNARQYFDENRTPLGEKQIQELVDVDIPIADYWEYRDGLKKQEKIEDKFEYIAGLDLPVAKKNILINNVVDRKTPVDLTGYDRFSGYEEFDFYSKNTEKYNFLKENGVSYERYMADETDKKNFDNDYSWYKNNPDKVAVAKLLTGNVLDYRSIVDDLGDLPAKEQKVQYINDLNMDYGKKIILYRTLYSSKEDKQLYNRKILEYLFGQNLPNDQLASILKTLGFVVKDGYVTW